MCSVIVLTISLLDYIIWHESNGCSDYKSSCLFESLNIVAYSLNQLSSRVLEPQSHPKTGRYSKKKKLEPPKLKLHINERNMLNIPWDHEVIKLWKKDTVGLPDRIPTQRDENVDTTFS